MLVQVVGSKVVDRGEGIGHGDNRVSDGQRLGGNSHRRRSGRTDRRGGHEVGREGVLGIVHEVLDELEVLGLELLAGSLKTVDLLKLGLLLGQGLADDLAGLGVGLVADTVGVLDSVCGPWLNLFRRFIPPMGGVDFSPVVAIIALQLVQKLVLQLLIGILI